MKKSSNQLSIFDIIVEHPQENEITQTSETVPKAVKAEEKKNRPYVVPTVDEIMKRIKSAVYRVDTSQLIADVFECGAISIANTVDFICNEEREERYKQIINKYEPRERELLTEIFGKIYAISSSVVYDDGVFGDYLGDLFMRCSQGNKHTGQFFTPYHISKLMAKAAIGTEVVEKAKKGEVLTLCDPCCGGGGLILAALDVLKNDYNVNYTENCFIECSDIDLRCVHMTYLQLSLAGAPAIIKHQNSLTRELWSVWKTPAYIFQYMRFCKYENYN